MAFVPEDVEKKLFAKSKPAIQIFFFACKWRNHEDRTFRRSLVDCRKNMKRATFYRGLADLGDLIRHDHDKILWIAGDFSPVEEKYKSQKRDKTPENGAQFPVTSLTFETNPGDIPKIETESAENAEEFVSELGQNCLKSETHPPDPHKEILNSNQQDQQQQRRKPAKSGKSEKPEQTRIPLNFAIDESMRKWAEAMLPGLDIDAATESFIEHFTNRTDKKAWKTDWRLTWKKGMRLAKKWQDEDAGGKFSPAQLRKTKHNGNKPDDDDFAHLEPDYGDQNGK